MKFLITINTGGGIGNRIHMLVNEMRLARDHYKMDCVINWKKK